MICKYQCCNCQFKWQSEKPLTAKDRFCGKCESIYFRWTNYLEWRKQIMKPLYGDKY